MRDPACLTPATAAPPRRVEGADPPELLSTLDLARKLGIDERSARKLAIPGRIRVGRVFKFKRRVIERWLEEGGA